MSSSKMIRFECTEDQVTMLEVALFDHIERLDGSKYPQSDAMMRPLYEALRREIKRAHTLYKLEEFDATH